jgi:hypothetical protein
LFLFEFLCIASHALVLSVISFVWNANEYFHGRCGPGIWIGMFDVISYYFNPLWFITFLPIC